MGKEAKCIAHIDGDAREVRALLEETGVHLRGGFKFDLPLSEVTQAVVMGERLLLVSGRVRAELELGEQTAIAWSQYIEKPPTLAEKLGIKPQHKVALLGFSPMSELDGSAYDHSLVEGTLYDAILVLLNRSAGLKTLRPVLQAMAPKGFLWIAYPRGSKEIPQSAVFAAGKGLGLVDVKVCRFSETHTALKFVRRVTPSAA